MKTLRGKLSAKITAIFLLCALVVVCVLSAIGTAYLSDVGAYSVSLERARSQALESAASNYLYEAGREYKSGNTQPLYLNTNFRYTILSPEGEELLATYEGEAALWEGSKQVYPSFVVESVVPPEQTAPAAPEAEEIPKTPLEYAAVETPRATPTPRPTPVPTAAPQAEARNTLHLFCYDTSEEFDFLSDAEVIRWRNANALTVKGYVLEELPTEDEFSRTLDRLQTLYSYRIALPCLAGLSFVLGVLLFLFLLSSAGHRDGTETVTENFVDRIPLDLFTALIAAGILALCVVAFGAGLPRNVVGYTLGMVLLLLMGLLFLLFCMSFATRVKRGTLWQNCLLVRLWHWCGRTLRGLLRLLGRGLRALPLLWRWVALLAALMLLELFLLAISDGDPAPLFFVHLFVLCPAVLALVWCLRRLRLGAKELAAGNLDYTVDTRYLIGELKDHANDLNHIRDGLNAAVEERMKSEHFKSELITNVSHDIKTPLTSIVNYVDLLEKEPLENETAREYVAVLARQSARLKKLLDDLIEASKASTGVLPVHAERCELGVLLDQCAGEYGERLLRAQLEPVILKPDEPVAILADGRHMWRIFDNLLGNVVKYAQPGTRVYLSLSREGSKACLTFRNISREPLNLSGEALMERFVRGDSSRSTEGSGLGLAIARSLAQLQGGEMDLSVDGDLFKITLRFDALA